MRSPKLLLFVILVCAFAAARAHPLGNATVNRWAQLSVSAASIEIDYVLDLAELPTLVEISTADRDGNGEVSAAEWGAYAKRWAQTLPKMLKVELDGRPVALAVREQRWKQQEGEAGLATLRLEARLRADPGALRTLRSMSLTYADETNASALGWKEVVLRASDDVRVLRTTLPRADRSRRLTSFPANADSAYSNITFGSATFSLAVATPEVDQPRTPGALPAVADTPAAANEPPSAHSDLVSSLEAQAEPPAQPAATKQPQMNGLLLSYFKLGMHHIATGWDHLLFLFGLLLLRLELRRIVLVVTAFTLAHSLTLSIAALGLITPPSTWIEPAIALTIAYVGLINLTARGRHHGAWLAFGFGLVHGFGFAGALAQSAATHSIQGTQLLLSLASFNLGIETLQVALVLLVVPVLRWCAGAAWYAPAQRAAAACLAVSGVGVFLARLSGTT